MAERLAGKVALVSGGARGMGASHVRTLVAEGAKVVFGDILDDEGEAVASEFNSNAARYVHLDVTKPDDWEAAVARWRSCSLPARSGSMAVWSTMSLPRTAISPWCSRITRFTRT